MKLKIKNTAKDGDCDCDLRIIFFVGKQGTNRYYQRMNSQKGLF